MAQVPVPGSAAEPLARARPAPRPWQLYLAVGFTAVVAYYLIPNAGTGRTVRTVLYCLISASAAVAVVGGIRHHRPARLRPWLLLAVAQVLYAAGDTTFYTAHEAFHELAYPGPADVFYLARFPVIVSALVLFVREREPRSDLPGLLDASMIAVAAGLLSWLYLIRPQTGSGLLLATSIAYPVLDLAMAVAACRLLLGRGQRPPSYVLLAGSLLLIFTSDTLYVLQQLHGTYSPGNFLDGIWLAGNLLLGAAALHPTMVSLADPLPVDSRSPGSRRLAVLSAAALVAPVVLFVQSLQGTPRNISLIAVVSAVTFLLAIARMAGLVSDQRHLATTDDLTGLRTRRYLEDQLPVEMARAGRNAGQLALLILDVDHFKSVNDRWGHPAGDRVLTEIAARLRAATEGSEVLARYGGEEFAVLVPGGSELALPAIAERLRHGVAATPIAVTDDEWIAVTVSVGAGGYPVHADDQEQLVAVADRALYAAKAEGRDRSVIGRSRLRPGARAIGGRRLSAEYLFSVADGIDATLSDQEHGRAVGRWAWQLALELGLDRATVQDTELAGRLHDIGKLVLPQSVLRKPGALDEDEWQLMRQHPRYGARLAAPIPGFGGVAEIIGQHHECWNGSGYPERLVGRDIRIEARIVSVCDAWAAMRSNRPYQAELPVDEARARLALGRQLQFDAEITECFLDLQASGVLGDLRQAVVPAGRTSAARRPVLPVGQLG